MNFIRIMHKKLLNSENDVLITIYVKSRLCRKPVNSVETLISQCRKLE